MNGNNGRRLNNDEEPGRVSRRERRSERRLREAAELQVSLREGRCGADLDDPELLYVLIHRIASSKDMSAFIGLAQCLTGIDVDTDKIISKVLIDAAAENNADAVEFIARDASHSDITDAVYVAIVNNSSFALDTLLNNEHTEIGIEGIDAAAEHGSLSALNLFLSNVSKNEQFLKRLRESTMVQESLIDSLIKAVAKKATVETVDAFIALFLNTGLSLPPGAPDMLMAAMQGSRTQTIHKIIHEFGPWTEEVLGKALTHAVVNKYDTFASTLAYIVSPTKRYIYDMSPLAAAIDVGDFDVIWSMLHSKLSNFADEEYVAFISAINKNDTDVFTFMLDETEIGNAFLHSDVIINAAMKSADIVRVLLNKGVVDSSPELVTTIIEGAAETANSDVINALIQHGTDLSGMENHPVILVAASRIPEALAHVLERNQFNADVVVEVLSVLPVVPIESYALLLDYVGRDHLPAGITSFVSGTDSEEVLKLFLRYDSDPSAANNVTLRNAVSGNAINNVRTLLNRIKNRRLDGAELIMIAAGNDNPEMLDLLLRDGRADPTESNSIAIVRASETGNAGIMQMLLRDGRADPSTVSNAAINIAAREGHDDAVRLLLNDPRVDPTDRDNEAVLTADDLDSFGALDLLIRNAKVFSTLGQRLNTVPETLVNAFRTEQRRRGDQLQATDYAVRHITQNLGVPPEIAEYIAWLGDGEDITGTQGSIVDLRNLLRNMGNE